MNSLRSAGLHGCADIVIPLGVVNFTVIALRIKQDSCDAAECSCLLSSALALSSALQDAGLNIPLLFDAGPAQAILASPATIKASTGDFFVVQTYYSGRAYHSFVDALKRYDPH